MVSPLALTLALFATLPVGVLSWSATDLEPTESFSITGDEYTLTMSYTHHADLPVPTNPPEQCAPGVAAPDGKISQWPGKVIITHRALPCIFSLQNH
jgi:hypothetical protein